MNTRTFVIAGISLAALALAGCTTTSPEPSGEGELVHLRVGVQPTVEAAPLHLGIQQGFFEEHGIELELVSNLGGGAPITAQVEAGEIEIGFSNPTSLVLARSNGLDVQVIAPASAAGNDENDAQVWILSKGGSGIDEAADLEGKTIAVNAVQNILEFTIKDSLDGAGVDIDTLKFVEIPFPDMAAALDGGQVDAVASVEPFVAGAIANGATRVWNPYENVRANLPNASYFSSGRWIAENADTVQAFREALAESAQYAIDHPDEMRSIITTYTEMTEETLTAMRFPVILVDIDRDAYQTHIDLVKKWGKLNADVTVDDLLAP